MNPRRRGGAGGLIAPSHRLLRLFRIYVRWYLRRHFHALRIAHAERFSADPAASSPLIFCINHPSWWDPLTAMLIADYLLPGVDHYAPMDAAALKHYGMFRRMGIFPVEQGTARGAAQFLRSSRAVLERGVLWVTPQGAFTDVRSRPLSFKPGLAALVRRLPQATIIPLAFEYTYWNERLPEILVNVGEPLLFNGGESSNCNAEGLEASMAKTLDELAALGMTRDPRCFHILLSGSTGVGGIYEAWQRFRTALGMTGPGSGPASTRGAQPKAAQEIEQQIERGTGLNPRQASVRRP